MINQPEKPTGDLPPDASADDPETTNAVSPDQRAHSGRGDKHEFQVEGFKTIDPVNFDGLPDIPGFRPEDYDDLVELIPDPEGPLANVSLIKKVDPDESKATESDLEAYITELAEKHNLRRDQITIRFQEDNDGDC